MAFNTRAFDLDCISNLHIMCIMVSKCSLMGVLEKIERLRGMNTDQHVF